MAIKRKSEDTTTDPAHFEDILSKYIRRIEEAEEHFPITRGIITSDDLVIPPLTRGRIKRQQIAWRLYQHQMFYIVKVEPGAYVPKHAHTEDVFRLIMEGSLTVNGKKLEAGQWFVVQADVPYEIDTKCGYTVMAGYKMACKPINN